MKFIKEHSSVIVGHQKIRAVFSGIVVSLTSG